MSPGPINLFDGEDEAATHKAHTTCLSLYGRFLRNTQGEKIYGAWLKPCPTVAVQRRSAAEVTH